jgi:hypothetical protein
VFFLSFLGIKESLMNPKKGLRLSAALVVGLMVVQVVSAAGKASPTLNLLPKDYSSYANEVNAVTRQMGGSIDQHLATISKQTRFYKETCGDDSGIEDKGCAKAREAVANSYVEVLTVVGNSLPVMRKKMQEMSKMLKSSIRKNVGKQNLPALMEMTSGKGTARSGSRRINKSRKRSFASIGHKLQKLLKLKGGGPAFAATEYLDLQDALGSLEGLEAAIESERAYVSLNKQVMMITPEMEFMVSEIDAIINPESADSYEDGISDIPTSDNEWN